MADSMATKKALAQALKDLMRAQPLQKISVGDICAACSMNRKTFYYHFYDKYDAVNWIFYTECIENILRTDALHPAAFLLELCSYFYDNRAFYSAALSDTSQNNFSEYFAEVMSPILHLHFSDFIPDEAEREFRTDFYTDAFLAALRRWLSSPNPMPPDKFAALARRAVAGAEG